MRIRTFLVLGARGLAAYWRCSHPLRRSDLGDWRFHRAAAMGDARAHPGAALLGDGSVLLCGGADSKHEPLRTCERYDPRADRWAPAATMDQPRGFFLMVRLLDGRVLAVGVESDYRTTSAAIYNPALDRWETIAEVPRPATNASLTAMPNGEAVLVAGSFLGNDVFESSFVLDPVTATWRSGPELRLGREAHCAAWTDEGLIVAGGRGQYEPCWPNEWLCVRGGKSPSLRSVERLAAGDRRWKRGHDAPTALPYCRSIQLGHHALLAIGDEDSARYDSARDRWQSVAAPRGTLSARAFAPLPGGGAIAVGGYASRDAPAPTASLVLATNGDVWQWGPALAVHRTWATAIALADGRVLVAGGAGADTGALADVEIFGP